MWPRKMFRKNRSASQDFSSRNGEMLLRTQISLSQGHPSPLRLFTLGEIQEATRRFHPSRRVGTRFSRFYWGVLDDDRKIVVENWNALTDESDGRLVEAVITEIVVLSNTRHRNVVKLLGCCLETPVPLPVCEFVPHGSLEDAMRRWSAVSAPPLSTRLQIAVDVADALAYLHSHTSRPIVHKGVQTRYVIFDEDYTAKLAGFTFSVPIPSGKTHVEDNFFPGSIHLTDPEHIATRVVTEKADTYAFGLLLLELLIGVSAYDQLYRKGNDLLLRVLYGEGDMEVCASVGRADVEEGRAEERRTLMDVCVAKLVADASALGDAEGKANHIRAVAELVLRCARFRGEQRPTMKEVAEELRIISRVPPFP